MNLSQSVASRRALAVNFAQAFEAVSPVMAVGCRFCEAVDATRMRFPAAAVAESRFDPASGLSAVLIGAAGAIGVRFGAMMTRHLAKRRPGRPSGHVLAAAAGASKPGADLRYR